MNLIRKTYTLSEGTIQKLEEIITKSVEKNLNLTESTLVRLALAEGLPIVTEKLNLQEISLDEQRTIEAV